MAVTLNWSGGAGSVDEGFDVPLSSGVISEAPIVRLELWDEFGVVDDVDFTPPATVAGHVWSWTADGVGSHVFVVRAVDTVGRTGESPPVWVTVAPLPGQAQGTASGDGAPARGEVASSGGSATAVPAVDYGHAAGLTAALPGPTDAPQVDLSPGGCVATVTVAPVIADGLALYGAAESAAAFALLDVFPATGGSVAVEIPGGMSVFRTTTFGGADASFSSLVPVEADPSCTTGKWSGEAALVGGHLTSDAPADRAYLYLSAGTGPWQRYPAGGFVPRSGDGFDFSSLLPSAGPDGALTFEAWGRGDAGLVFLGGGTLGGAAPAGALSLVGAATFAGPLHPSLVWVKHFGHAPGVDVVGENQGQVEVLATHGRICRFKEQSSSVETSDWCVFLPPSSTPEVGSINVDSSSGLMFRWDAGAPQATHGIWQVSAFPPPSGPMLDFIGLLAFGEAPNTGGDFPIDLATVLYGLENPGKSPSTPAASQPLQWGDLSSALAASASASASSGPASAEEMTSVTPGGAATGKSSAPSAVSVATTHPDVLYVRVVALAGTQPLAASDPVKFLIDWTPTGKLAIPEAGFSIMANISPPTPPNYDYKRCVRVMENPFGSANPVADSQKGYPDQVIWQQMYNVFAPAPPGKTICAKYHKPKKPSFLGSIWKGITAAVDFVSKVWDGLADFVNDVKAGIIDLAAKFSGCEAVAEAAGMSDEDAKTTCVGGLTLAANAALAAYGIPPTMPKFDAVVSAAKGELRDAVKKAVREQMKDAGLDCDETGVFSAECEKLVEKEMNDALDAIEEKVGELSVESAGSGENWYLYLNPAIKVIPEPASTLQGPVFDVTITKTKGGKNPPTCAVGASARGIIHDYSWWDYVQDTKRVGETVSGDAFLPVSTTFDPAGMNVGDSRSFNVALNSIAEWYPPGSSKSYSQKVDGHWVVFLTGEDPHTGDFFGPNAQVTTQIDTCAGSVALTWSYVGPTQPQDLTPQPAKPVAP